ncbi:MAG: hypothetical protein ACYCW6_19555 [Candidatus Xenobia bacterium]
MTPTLVAPIPSTTSTTSGISPEEARIQGEALQIFQRSLPQESAARETLDRVLALSKLPEGWDGEDAVAPIGTVVETAARIVLQSAFRTQESSLSWISPDVGPNPDGEIALCWRAPERQVLVIVKSKPEIVLVRQSTGVTPTRIVTDLDATVAAIVWVLTPR